MKKIVFLMLFICFSSAQAGWSESHGGDGVVSDFTMIARSLVLEMENDSNYFSKDFTEKFKKSIEETIISSADSLVVDGVEKDAISYALVRPYKIEVSRKKWLQYETTFMAQELLVLHEFLSTLHVDDADYDLSKKYYGEIVILRMNRNNMDYLGPFLLKASEDCNEVKISTLADLGVSFNFADSDNRNALFFAANSGCSALVDKFLALEVPALKSIKNSWHPWFAAFVGAHKSVNDSEKFNQYYNALISIFLYHLDVDGNNDATFSSDEYPPQLNACAGQTMFMRSLIGINFYSDDKKSKTINIRNLQIAGLLKGEGASLTLKDSCGKSAKDYAKIYKIDLKSF